VFGAGYSQIPRLQYLLLWTVCDASMATMNLSYPLVYATNLPPAIEQASHEVIRAAALLLIPAELLYFSVYFHRKRLYKVYTALTFSSLATFWLSPILAPVSCGPARCLKNFASKSYASRCFVIYDADGFTVAIGTMKLLDFWARRKSFPQYTGKTPSDWYVSTGKTSHL